jgi:hypothetical protein
LQFPARETLGATTAKRFARVKFETCVMRGAVDVTRAKNSNNHIRNKHGLILAISQWVSAEATHPNDGD